jgi:hypothetical protein
VNLSRLGALASVRGWCETVASVVSWRDGPGRLQHESLRAPAPRSYTDDASHRLGVCTLSSGARSSPHRAVAWCAAWRCVYVASSR